MLTKTESELLERVHGSLFIGGKWVQGREAADLEVTDPATGALLKRVADASPADGKVALDSAVQAFPAWAATPPRERAEILRRSYELVLKHADDFALLMTLEMGKPLPEARAEVTYGAEFLRWFSEEAVRVHGRYGSTPEGHGRMIVTRHAVGPCYLITPWNFPLAMATRKLGPSLAAGCTVVLKPASQTPLTTLFLTQLMSEAGVPPGVLNVITTSDSDSVSREIMGDPRLRKLSFTGSTQVGVDLLKKAADNVLATSMELGGNAPFLVFEDADLDDAVAGAMQAKFRNIGQACTAANRFLVHSSVLDEFTDRLLERISQLKVGRGTDPGVEIGPLINGAAVGKTTGLIEDAQSRGARLRVGGEALEGPGSFLAPTLLDQVAPDSKILQQEIFAPVVVIVPFETEEQAVQMANATEYGLMSYAYTRDLARAQRLIEQLETGVMALNAGVASNAAGPFGGWKSSGLGREGAGEGIDAYLETKYTMTPNPFTVSSQK